MKLRWVVNEILLHLRVSECVSVNVSEGQRMEMVGRELNNEKRRA